MFASGAKRAHGEIARSAPALAMLVCMALAIASFHSTRPGHLFFRSPNVVCAAEGLAPGLLVEFATKDGSVALGAVTEADGKKNWKILKESGATVSVPPSSIRHIFPARLAPSSEAALKAITSHEAAARQHCEGTFDGVLAEVWEMALEEDSPISLTELSELLISDTKQVSEAYYSTYRLLGTELGKAYFRSNKDGTEFVARPKVEAEALRAQARAAAAAADAEQTFRERIQQAIDGRSRAAPPFALSEESAEVQAAFGALEAYACRARLDETDKESRPSDEAARELLQRLGRKATAEAGRQLLVALGLWDLHENLELKRLEVPTRFDESLLAEAAALEAAPPEDVDAARRVDLTKLLALAIDEASTVEVDDAMSVECFEDGSGSDAMRLWIHIADPTRYVARGSALEVEARRRMSSIYLPTGTLPMFPLSLAAGPLSLRDGVVSCALSFGVRLGADGGIDEAHAPIITTSLVCVRRLTYLRVDELLDASSDPFANLAGSQGEVGEGQGSAEADDATLETLRRLSYLSQRRLEWRIAGGSMERHAPEGLPDMTVKARAVPGAPDGWEVDVSVGGARTDGVARRIVSEAMLLAGEAAARYGVAHELPMPYRAQSVREELSDDEVADCPAGPCRAWLAIRRMKPSFISPTPAPHMGLALEAYVQVTSPIRRHADLAVHYQLKAHLRSEPLPYPADAPGGASEIVRLAREASSSPVRSLERSTNAYWLAEYLKRNVGRPLRATVLGSGDGRNRDVYKLLLTDLGAVVDCATSTPLQLGAELEVAPNRRGEFGL